MTKKNETKDENEAQEKGVLLGHLTYLPYKEKGNSSRIGPVFSTRREDCQSVVVESVPMRLIQDMNEGNIGSFFIWAKKSKGASA
jgi:hypothetical protein